MKHYEEFEISGATFAERTGDPDEFSCAIGRIAINFSELEDQISKGIATLLGASGSMGDIVISELSFRSKVHIFASLVRECHRQGIRCFNVGNAPLDEDIKELCANCFRAEELRNTIMHSSWRGPYIRDAKAIRMKTSAKSQQGFRLVAEEIGSAYLLDIADFTICVASDVEQFMYDVEAIRQPAPSDIPKTVVEE